MLTILHLGLTLTCTYTAYIRVFYLQYWFNNTASRNRTRWIFSVQSRLVCRVKKYNAVEQCCGRDSAVEVAKNRTNKQTQNYTLTFIFYIFVTKSIKYENKSPTPYKQQYVWKKYGRWRRSQPASFLDTPLSSSTRCIRSVQSSNLPTVSFRFIVKLTAKTLFKIRVKESTFCSISG